MNPSGIFTSIYRVPQSMRPGPCLAHSLLLIPVKHSLQRMVLYKQQASQGTPYVRVCLGNNIFYKLTLHAPAVTGCYGNATAAMAFPAPAGCNWCAMTMQWE
jgi:hypothetical protein